VAVASDGFEVLRCVLKDFVIWALVTLTPRSTASPSIQSAWTRKFMTSLTSEEYCCAQSVFSWALVSAAVAACFLVAVMQAV
jgi:hypothetical protein